jgi:hypothetical protein
MCLPCQEIVAGSVKVEELPKYWQEKLSIPADLIRSEEERIAFGKQVMEAAQQGIGGGIDETGGI